MDRETSVVNAAETPWDEGTQEDRFKRKTLALKAGGKKLGCSLYELQPGRSSWPLHYHFANEEAIYVLEGRGSLRLPQKQIPLRAGDYVALPVGPHSAHQIINDSDRPLTYLCLSTMEHPDVAVYPESDKVGIFVGSAPGSLPDPGFPRAFFHLKSKVGYWEGEK